jgi:hypothetical protein
MSVEDLGSTLNITVDQIEKQIIDLVSSLKMNGKKCADLLIRHWEASDPDYIEKNYQVLFTYKPKDSEEITVRMKQLPEEVLSFYRGPKGDYLHSFKYSGVLTEEIKAVICEHLMLEYKQKTDELKL